MMLQIRVVPPCLVLVLGFPHWHYLSIGPKFLVVVVRDLGFYIEILEQGYARIQLHVHMPG